MLSTPLRSRYIRHFILSRNLDQFPRLFSSFPRTFLRYPCARFTKNLFSYYCCLCFAFLRDSWPVHWKVPKTSNQSKTVVDTEYERQSPLKKALCDRERIHVTGRIVYATLTCDSNRRKRDTVDVTRFIYAHTWLTYKSSISARYWQSGGIRLFDSRTLTSDKWQRLITAAYSRPLAHRYPRLARLDRWEIWFAQSFQTNEQRANICSLIPRIFPLCFDLFVQPFSRSIDLWLGG